MADWTEAQERLDQLRAESRAGLPREVIRVAALENILWMASDENQHLDMFALIRQAAQLGLNARGNRTGDLPLPVEDGVDVPWPPSS